MSHSDRARKVPRSRFLDQLEARPLRPLSSLAPKAQRLLAAAQRIVIRDGFSQLSFARIAKEAGVYQSAVRYYFGSKAGLVQALVDATTRDLSVDVSTGLRKDDPLPERLEAMVQAVSRLPASREYEAMWEMLPNVLHDDELRRGVADLYEEHRSHNQDVLDEEDDPDLEVLTRSYASLMLAVLDGMAIQKALDPEGVDLDRVFQLWAKVLSRTVEGIIEEETSQPVEP
jgi:AcrR family transcriptional regulator